MSTSLLYLGFGIRGYQYVRIQYEGGEVTFTIRQDPDHWRCQACGSCEGRPGGQAERRFR